MAKKLGSPERFVAAILAVGAVMGVSTELGGKKVVRVGKAAVKKQKAKQAAKAEVDERNKCDATKGQLFAVTADGADSSAGLSVRSGDSFRVLECDGEAILIEVLKNPNNPYGVSAQFLAAISAFPAKGAAPGA